MSSSLPLPNSCVRPCAPVMLTDSVPLWILGGLLFGVASGSEYGLVPYALQRYFGRGAFGELYGIIYGIVWLSMGVFPLISAALFDLLGSYDVAFMAMGGSIFAAALMLLTLPRYDAGAAQ